MKNVSNIYSLAFQSDYTSALRVTVCNLARRKADEDSVLDSQTPPNTKCANFYFENSEFLGSLGLT